MAITAGPSSDYRIEALRYGTEWTGPNLTFSFFAGGTYYGSETVGTVSDAVKANVRYILQEIYEPIINLTFTEVVDTPTGYGQLRFMTSSMSANPGGYAYAFLPPFGADNGTDTQTLVAGDVHLNPANDGGADANNSFQSGPGSYGFETLIHEIGHALGLKHPHNFSPPNLTVLPVTEDNWDNTVMSYTQAGNLPATPMPYDILALQYFYGANTSTRATDTTYVFTQVDEFSPGSGMTATPTPIFSRMKHTLWDGGGVDTVDFGQLPTELDGYVIDIRAGGWITKAGDNSVPYTEAPRGDRPGGSGTVTDFGTRIALDGAVIENVVVSNSSDAILLNGAANRVSGYKPGVATGTDAIFNSNELDTLDLSLFAKASVVESQVGNDLFLILGTGLNTVRIMDYYAAVPSQRITILFQSEPTVSILSDLASLRAGQTSTITFSLGMTTTNFVVGDVTVTGGSLSGFTGSGKVYTATFTPTPNFEGTASIVVPAGVFTDAAGLPNEAGQLLLPIDTRLPTVAITRSGSGAILVGGSTTITFTLSENSTSFAAGDVTVTGGSLSGFAGSGKVYTGTFTPSVGFVGNATIAVAGATFTDAAGNPNTASATLSIPVETLLPTVTITRTGSGTVVSGASVAITFTLSTPATNFTASDVTVSGGTLSGFSGSGSVYTATFSPTAGFQGTATITVAAGTFTSLQGNANQAGSLSLPVDTKVPSLTITRSGSGPLRIGGTALITFTISEPVTTFTAGKVSVTGGSLINFVGSGAVYTATFVPAAGFQGTAAITVAAGAIADSVGNANSPASLQIPIDTLAPTVAILATAPALLKVGNTATFTFTLSEPAANFGVGKVTVNGGTLTNFQGSGTFFTATFVPASQFQGTATVRVLASGFTDLAGNGNLASNVVSLSVDTRAATIVGFRATPTTANLGIGGSVVIMADFSAPVTPGGSFVLHLNSGGVVNMVVAPSGLTAQGTYTAKAGNFSADLDVVQIVANSGVLNSIGNPLSPTLPAPATSLAGRHAITVDARVKFVSQGAFSTDPNRVPDVKAQFRQIPIRFSTPVYGLTLASLRLTRNGVGIPLTGAKLQGSGAAYMLTLARPAGNYRGIYKLSITPGGGSVTGVGSGAAASDQVSLYWGCGQSIGMLPSAPGGVAPLGLIPSGTRTSVVIGWQTPAGNGGGAIQSYLVQYRVVGTGGWRPLRTRVPGNVTSVTIPGVALNRLYEFRVAAVNSVGTSPFGSSGVVSLANSP